MHTVTGSRQRIANEFGGAVECKSRKMKKKQDCGVHIIPSGELVEHQGGARQKSQTEASSALLTEWTVHNNFNQFDSVTMTFSDQQTVTKLQESTNIFQKSVIGVPTSGHNDCFCSSAH